jgi:hypothetical protein
MATGAIAADPVTVVAPTPPAPPMAAQGFDWGGFYAGAVVEGVFNPGSTFGWFVTAAQMGYNFTFNRILLGASAAVGAWFYGTVSGGGPAVELVARAGVALDRAAIYGLLGAVGYGPGGLSWYSMGGVGIELAVGDRVSIFGEVRLEELFSPPFYPHVTGGVNFHFGN